MAQLRLLIIGAHPDDCEYAAGGMAAWYRQMGHDVLMVSMTNGDAGHHLLSGAELAKRRLTEAKNAALVIGAAARSSTTTTDFSNRPSPIAWR